LLFGGAKLVKIPNTRLRITSFCYLCRRWNCNIIYLNNNTLPCFYSSKILLPNIKLKKRHLLRICKS